MASAGAARDPRWRAHVRIVVRFRALYVPQRQDSAGGWKTSLLLFAEDGEPPGSPALERRDDVLRGASRNPAWIDPGDGADRDDPCGVRDGRDPVRAARPFAGAELRTLG